jgi:hypothetical protein
VWSQVEALSGVEGDRDVALEQDEGFVVGEVPLENGRVGGEEGGGEGGGLDADGAEDVGVGVGFAGDDVVAEG